MNTRPPTHLLPFCAGILFLLQAVAFSGCRSHPPYLYRVTAMQLYNENNSGKAPVDAPGADVAAKNYAMRLEFSFRITSNNGADRFESGYASSNPATAFTVYSLSDYDAAHPAHVSLNDYFLYSYSTNVSFEDSIHTLLDNRDIAIGYRKDDTDDTWKDNNYLVLMVPPASMGPRSFVVDIGFADNTHFTDTVSVTLH